MDSLWAASQWRYFLKGKEINCIDSMYGIMKSGSLMYNLELMPPLHGYFVMQLFANDVPKTVSSG